MTPAAHPDETSVQASDAEVQFLTFAIGTEEYGIEILHVQEIKGYSNVTPVPSAPSFVKGVMNLRGVIVPVIDLRTRFGLEPTQPNPFTVFIVVVMAGRVSALIVDSVSDVLNVAPSSIQATSESGMSTSPFVRGVTNAADRTVIILELDRIIAFDEGSGTV